MSNIPVAWQYVILAASTLAVVVVGLWLYNRREERRRHAFDLAILMSEWGLTWIAELYKMYTIGDYSGLASKVAGVLKAVRSDEAMVRILFDCAKKVTAYCAANEPQKAAELMALLQHSPTPPAAIAKEPKS